MSCKGICIRHRVHRPAASYGRYATDTLSGICNGTERGVLVVDVKLGQDPAIQRLNKN
jgi:hypothetical protein